MKYSYYVVLLGETVGGPYTLPVAIDVAKPRACAIAKYDAASGNFIGWLWAAEDYQDKE